MTIGIMTAMPQEAERLAASLKREREHVHGGRTYFCGTLEDTPVVLVYSRIGKVAAAATAQHLIDVHRVSSIVFTGVAGGLAPGLSVGDVVVADRLWQHDMDASPLFPRFEVPLYGRARFDTDGALSARVAQAARQVLADASATLGVDAVAEFALHAPTLHAGLILSGDRFVATSAESAALRQALPEALAVEMEGAAVAQVCHDWALPFAALRTVSDRADDSAHVDFMRFIDQVASRYSAAVLEAYFSSL